MCVKTRKSDTHKERYYHFSLDDALGQISHATVFIREDKVSTVLLDKPWGATLSLCSTHDQFCRKIGRQVARRRFFRGDKVNISGDKYEDAKEFLQNALDAAFAKDNDRLMEKRFVILEKNDDATK